MCVCTTTTTTKKSYDAVANKQLARRLNTLKNPEQGTKIPAYAVKCSKPRQTEQKSLHSVSISEKGQLESLIKFHALTNFKRLERYKKKEGSSILYP